MIKKIFAPLLLTFVLVGQFIVLSPAVFAATHTLVGECNTADLKATAACQGVNDKTQTVTSNKFYGEKGILTKAAGIIAFIGGITAIIMIILGGFTFITGSGDPNTLSAARKTVLYAVVGLVVIVLPSAIIRLVVSRL